MGGDDLAGTGSKVSLLSAGSSEVDPDRMSLGPLSRMEMLLTASPVCVSYVVHECLVAVTCVTYVLSISKCFRNDLKSYPYIFPTFPSVCPSVRLSVCHSLSRRNCWT